MAITLGSSSIVHPDELKDELSLRSELIEECNQILKHLRDGTYLISWNGVLPGENKILKIHGEKRIEIKIDSLIRYGKFLHPWKPYVSKKVKIEGKEIASIRTWNTQQIAEFLQKIKSLD